MPEIQKISLSSGGEVAVRTAGDVSKPALVLLHGFPNSSRMFSDVTARLSGTVYVVAPDLPGFGASDLPSEPSFDMLANAIEELLASLNVGRRLLYLHDFGAPVAFQLAMRAPELVEGLIIQNANAHRSGFGPQWAATLDFWAAPNAGNEEAATAHLTLEGTRDQYVAGLPPEIAARIDAERWIEDWRVMCLPGRLDLQKALLADYGRYVDRFGEVADYLAKHQPRAMLLWGRHDVFFDIAEVQSWLIDLPRMEAHIFDAGHLLLETQGPRAAELIREFVDAGSP
ncbi:alpha/beta hydrolase [Mesorhizobium sp. M0239]|uniref:alpha/beta fold hydrolase n=1 Tax=unclassified Mesorhizobium TaxID=325217 RepID=UPI003339241E